MTTINYEATFWAAVCFAILIVTYRAGARVRFRVKCPCCLKELVIDPKRETANLPTFKDQED